MSAGTYNLAIETSSRAGSIALGRADGLLGVATLDATARHSVGLMPGIAALCDEHGIKPAQLGQVYLSHGPGSFTGLRVAVAVVKMLALVHDVRVVAVPTVRVLAENVPAEDGQLLVCVNQKRDTVYAARFEVRDDRWEPVGDAGVRQYERLLGETDRPVAVLGDPLPVLDEGVTERLMAGVRVLGGEYTQPRAEVVYRLGRRMAQAGEYVDAAVLEPLYAREPEAVTLWNQRQAREERNEQASSEKVQRP